MLTLDQILARETWTALAPEFRIGDDASFARAAALPLDDARCDDMKDRLSGDGYFQESGLDWGVDPAAMAAVVRAVAALGVPPVFAFMYDEFWLPFHRLRDWYGRLLGDYTLSPEFWAWNLEPKTGDAGWAPHRDKDYRALRPDGQPSSLTTWIPLSPATPLNGCMYIVPACFDPAYGTARDNEAPQFSLGDVRALPAVPGDVLMWNTAVMHWGGRTSPRAPQSRVSIAIELQRTDVPPYNRPALQPGRLPPYRERLRLIAAQIMRYRRFQRFDDATLALATKLGG